MARQSWTRYQTLVRAVAERHGFGMVTGAAVFAALSPNSDYCGNIRDCGRLLAAAQAGKTLEQFQVSTYGANKIKAWRIAMGERPLDLIVANKTRNFFLNISNPDDPIPVTVDGHIFNAWHNKRIPLNSAEMKSSSRLYGEVAEAIRQIGAERGILPCVVQGLLWHTWKRIHRIKYTKQLQFWADDYYAAGLGFWPDW